MEFGLQVPRKSVARALMRGSSTDFPQLCNHFVSNQQQQRQQPGGSTTPTTTTTTTTTTRRRRRRRTLVNSILFCKSNQNFNCDCCVSQSEPSQNQMCSSCESFPPHLWQRIPGAYPTTSGPELEGGDP